jgi:hypothetical protein
VHIGPKLILVIRNNPNRNLIVSMSIKQGFGYPKRRKGKGDPPILIYSNEWSLKELKRVSSHLSIILEYWNIVLLIGACWMK